MDTTLIGPVMASKILTASSLIIRESRVTCLFFLQEFLLLFHSQSFGKHSGIARPPEALKSCLLRTEAVFDISNES